MTGIVHPTSAWFHTRAHEDFSQCQRNRDFCQLPKGANFGSGRLIFPAEGPNLRRSLDGALDCNYRQAHLESYGKLATTLLCPQSTTIFLAGGFLREAPPDRSVNYYKLPVRKASRRHPVV